MRISGAARKNFYCEICETAALDSVTMGVESSPQNESLVPLCRGCGPVDLELMQLCREATIRCRDN